MAKKLIDLVKKQFGEAVLSSHSRLGNDTVVVTRESIAEIIDFLRNDDKTQMDFCRDITAVDYLNRNPRFDVVYVLYSMKLKHQLLLRVQLDESDVKLPTISHIYGCAGWLEREIFDMYGMIFEGHPDLRRVLLYEEFEGFPLRKDYAQQASQPRTELRLPERDSVEEFYEFHKEKPTSGSRSNG